METKVDAVARVLLPQQVRDDLGLREGSVLRIEEQDGQIVLLPATEPLALEDGVLVFTGKLEGDLDDALERDLEERLAIPLGPRTR